MIHLVQLLSIAFFILVIVHSYRTGVSWGVLLHQIMFVLFVYVVHVLHQLSSESAYDLPVYIISCAVVVVYIYGIFVASLVVNNTIKYNRNFFDFCINLPDWKWVSAIFAWCFFQAILVAKYGFENLYGFHTYLSHGRDVEISYIDRSLNGLLSILSSGAFVVFVIKIVSHSKFEFRRVCYAAALLFFIPNFAFGASAIGARRFVLATALLGSLIYIISHAGVFRLGQAAKIAKVFGVVVLSIFLSSYFQAIRQNASNPEIAFLLTEPALEKKLEGAGRFLVPNFDAESDLNMFRGTPFDLIYDAVNGILDGKIQVTGDVTVHSLLVSIPSAIFPSKPVDETDLLISQMVGIPFTDLSTSILGIYLVDFGWLGLPISICFSLIIIQLLFWYSSRFSKSILSLPFVGGWFYVVFGVETSLVGVLATLRDSFLCFGLLWFLRLLISASKLQSIGRR